MPAVIDKGRFFERVGYTPHEKQRLYHYSRARFRCPVCGRRYGKSKMAGTDLAARMLEEKRRYWAVGPTYDLGEKEFRVVWDTLMIELGFGRDKRVRRAYNKRSGEMYIELPWQTRLEVRSATHPETLVGEALDHVIMSEAAKHNAETWERFIRPALADHRGSADFPTTPEGMNWLYKLWQLGQNPDYPDYDSWQFPSWENSAVYPGGYDDPEIQLLIATMSPEEFDQEIGALFTQFKGRIYPEFEEKTHVRKHVYNPDWPNYVFMDFGFVNAFAAIDVQIDPFDRVYVWREYYQSYKPLRQCLAEMRSRPQPTGYKIDLCTGDPADPEGIMIVNQDFAPCVGLPEAKTNWRQGIECVKRFIRLRQVDSDEYGRPVEEPWFYVDHNCPKTIWELNNYRRKDTDLSVTESNMAGGAMKKDDHICDALRYGLVHLFELGAYYHLEDVWDDSRSGLLVPNGSTYQLHSAEDAESGAETFFSMASRF